MKTAFIQALQLLLSGDDELMNIISVTLRMGLTSSVFALFLGAPLGTLLGSSVFRGKNILVTINRTMMSLPPVVCGLICYLLFCGVGPLRHLRLLYTVQGMVIAQIILITPLIIGNVETYVSTIAPGIRETTQGLRLGKMKLLFLLVNESRHQFLATYLFGLGRAFAEVGAISMVGGAIAYKTNVMTTAIMNYTNMGNFVIALSLGYILLGISLILNVLGILLQRRFK